MSTRNTNNCTPIIPILAYYHIFNHPLQLQEIVDYSGMREEEVILILDRLVHSVIIEKWEGYYGIHNTPVNARRRKMANEAAKKIYPKALRRGAFIKQFPFVKAVFISGSLSKKVMYPDGDVDFFVVTQPHRLWITRMLLMLYKKTVLLNSRKLFCINYYVTTNALEIAEKNRFTATELVTAIPTGDGVWKNRLLAANPWVVDFYPGTTIPEGEPLVATGGKVANWETMWRWVDQRCMRITQWKWRKKFKEMPTDDFKVAMKSTPSVSKHHPKNYQKIVLDKYQSIYEQVCQEVSQSTMVNESIV